MDQNIANTALNTQVTRPNFDRSSLKSRIVHIGFGAFHRAHQALYTNNMLAKTNSDWGICEISLFGTKLIEQLRDQDHLYSVLEKDAKGNSIKISGAVIESVHPKLDSIHAVLEKMAEPQIAIVSLTITEKGYCADLNTGHLDLNNPLIIADLASPSTPQSAIGFIVEALRMRKDACLKPFTVMSCDNIQENSRVAQQIIVDYANKVDQSLGTWIQQHVSFPCTMVDRIVPAITDDSYTELAEHLGVNDPCGIVCESFSQWVIEDNFVNGRPEWDTAGATFVNDVRPFEEMKLRMLNGSHSFLAYLGYLAEHRYIYQTMQDEAFRTATLLLMTEEQAVTLSLPKDIDLTQYANLLISRFSNDNIKHETWQIATDGSQKLPQRLCESLRFHLKNNHFPPLLILGIAGWMVYVSERNEKGEHIIVNDPMLEQFRQAHVNSTSTKQRVMSLLSLTSIFGEDLIKNDLFVHSLIDTIEQLQTTGAKALVTKTIKKFS